MPRGQPPPQSPAAVVIVILSTRKSIPSRFLVSSVCMEKASNKLGFLKRKRKEKKGHGLVAALGHVLCQLSLTHKNKAPAAASSNEVQRVISRNIYCSRISNLERNPYRKIFFFCTGSIKSHLAVSSDNYRKVNCYVFVCLLSGTCFSLGRQK